MHQFKPLSDRFIAAGISLALILTVIGFIFVSFAARKAGLQGARGLEGVPIVTALFLYFISETDIPEKARKLPAIRGQLSIWVAWLMTLGVAPALNLGQEMPQWVIAVSVGPVLALGSIVRLVLSAKKAEAR